MVQTISTDALRAYFTRDEEFAVIDPRERQHFTGRHLLAASNIPLDELTERLLQVVPNQKVTCIFCDDGGGEASQAAGSAAELGYDDCVVLEGGLEAWRADGGRLFSGSSVPGKAFGEFIEKSCQTPAMTAAELYRRQQAGADILLIDSRTAEEHESYCIPGAVLCPGAELVYRVLPIAHRYRDIVVHCGGRTRSIIGAQTLIDAGCDNVYALENGTMAWQFEGHELEIGNTSTLPEPDAGRLDRLQRKAQAMADDWHIDRFRSIRVREERTRYLIDVRSKAEYESGHIKGSIHVPGGHLLQNVDRYLAVRNAVVVLIDNDRVRAITVAIWLRRMGWRRVYVFSLDDDPEKLEFGPGALPSPVEDRDLDPSDYADVEELMAQNRAYLEWEIALVDMLDGEPSAPYANE